MNDIWSILEIDPTDDKKAIRRAFAAQSRLHHPEEEPEYFAALNQAYKAALDYGAGTENPPFPADGFNIGDRNTAKKGGSSALFSSDGRVGERRTGEEEKNREPLQKTEEGEKDRERLGKKEEGENGRELLGKTEEGENSRERLGKKEEGENGRESLGKPEKEEEPPRISEQKTENEKTFQEKLQETEVSLLDRLNEAAEQAVQKSMETGALRDFIVLFENPKQAKQADTWKRFFLSEAFLSEQFSEEFGKGLLTWLSGQTLCPADNLPMGLLQELAIAYAFIPHFAGEEYFEGLKYPKEWYKVSVENTFPGRRYAAEIFNMQGRECDLKSMTGRIQRQPANKVRYNAFSDYLAMKEMSRDGRLTDREKETWQQILGLCQPCYLFERNGKLPGSGAYESRSESVVKLYVRWLRDEQLPREVLLFLYKKLDFKTLERSSTRGLYSALKEEVLRQCPRAEEILFGEEGTEQRIVKLYRTYSTLINDNPNNYDKFLYGETPEIRERAKAFFALPDWEQLKGEKGLFERIYGTSKRIVMPATVAETLVEHLMSGDFPEPERTELTESLLRSLSTERMCRELDYRCEISFGSAEIANSPDFWQYFLMRGFGFRHAKIRGSWEQDYIYVNDGQCCLPAYINYIYAPSRAWQRQFTGFDQETEEIEALTSMFCPMPGGGRLRVEFHYRYCLYFVSVSPDNYKNGFPFNSAYDVESAFPDSNTCNFDRKIAENSLRDLRDNFQNTSAIDSVNEFPNCYTCDSENKYMNEVQVTAPVLAFSELQEYAENLEKPEEFFFLLAVTAIEDADRSAARALTENWLRQIPLHPFIIPTVARMLAADNDRISGAAPNPKAACGERRADCGEERQHTVLKGEEYHMACGDREAHTAFRKEERHIPGRIETPEDKTAEKENAESKITEAVLYDEQERFCLRALVSESGFSIWRQLDYGWQDIIFRSAELGWRKWGEYTWEEYSQFFGGQIPEAGNAPGRESTKTPEGRKEAARLALRSLRQPKPRVRAAYSLEGMDISQKAVKILEAMGLPENAEGYCVLRYGTKKEKRHDRVFYGAFAPFGFDLKAHSPAHVRSRDFLCASSNTKIKEPKVLVGRFGWGFKYSPRSDYGPMYVYQGESGKFYAYGSIRMHRADSLDGLLADFFREEWEGVTECVSYDGCLTVSRLDHRLEYCYTEEDMLQSMSGEGDTVADKFTLFGGYGMWMEFVRWMDGILEPGLPSWVNAIVVGLDWERGGALTFSGIHEDERSAEIEEFEEKADFELAETAGDESSQGENTNSDDRPVNNAEDRANDSIDNAEDRANDNSVKSEDSSDEKEDGSNHIKNANSGNSPEEPDLTESFEGGGMQDKIYLPQAPLLIWGKGMDRRDRAEFLTSAMQWYVDCGRFAEYAGGRNIKILVSG